MKPISQRPRGIGTSRSKYTSLYFPEGAGMCGVLCVIKMLEYSQNDDALFYFKSGGAIVAF